MARKKMGRPIVGGGPGSENSPGGRPEPTPRQRRGVSDYSNGYGVLRSVLERARREAGCSLSDLTALSAQVDPYRLDTPAGHRDGQWLARAH